jgi:hypothetical protein
LNSQGTFAALLGLAFYMARRVDAWEDKRAALVARADQQHAWVLAGDDDLRSARIDSCHDGSSAARSGNRKAHGYLKP